MGYDMSRPCDRFERTPEMVATRHDQGAALALVQRSLACLDIQRLVRGCRGRQKAKRIKAAWARGDQKDNPSEKDPAVDANGAGGENGESDGGVGGGFGGDLEEPDVENEDNGGDADDATSGGGAL